MGSIDPLICRICLATDVKMYSLEENPYKMYTETIGVLKSNPQCDLKHVCYECAAILLKFYKLMEKSMKAQSALSSILALYQQITENSVKTINRHGLKLNSSLVHHQINPNAAIKIEYTEDQSLHIENVIEMTVKDEEKSPIYSDNVDFVDNSVVFVETPQIKVEPDICTEKVFVDIPVRRKPKNTKEKTRKKHSKKQGIRKTKKLKISGDSSLSKKSKLNGDKVVTTRRKKTMDEQILKCFNIVTLTHEEQISELQHRKDSPQYASAPYKCDICYKYYQNPESYNNHMVEHSDQHGPHECSVCKKRFRQLHAARRHRAGHRRQYRCRLCDYVCKQRQAHNHMNTHEGFKVTFKCKHCSFVTDTESRYLSHRRRHRGAAPCRACGRAFITERGLRLHRDRGRCVPEDSLTIEEHPCLECDIVFETEKALKVHLTTSKKHADKNNRSNICKKCVDYPVFSSREELSRHSGAAHRSAPAYPRQCNYCSVSLESGAAAWSHVRREHPARRAEHVARRAGAGALCELCGKGFKSISVLQAHSLTHTHAHTHNSARHAHTRTPRVDERRYVCELCTRCFKLKTNLTRHMVVHTGLRAHACPECDKRFTQTGSRDLHLRSVHRRLPPAACRLSPVACRLPPRAAGNNSPEY